MRIHRSAHVEKQQHLDAVAPLGNETQVEPARILRCSFDGARQVELFRNAFAREAAKPAQRDLDVAGIKLDRVIEIAKASLVPDLDRATAASAVLTDTNAFGVETVGAERARPRGADPLRSALMARALLLEPLFHRFHELVPAAEGFDQRLFFIAQRPFDHLADPFFRDFRANIENAVDTLEVDAEREIEAIVERLVLDQAGPREEIEVVNVAGDNPQLERSEQRQELSRRNRQLRGFKVKKKVDQHRLL